MRTKRKSMRRFPTSTDSARNSRREAVDERGSLIVRIVREEKPQTKAPLGIGTHSKSFYNKIEFQATELRHLFHS